MSDPLRVIQMTRGAATAVAQALGISRAAVSQWARVGAIPPARRADVEQALAAFMQEQHGGARASNADAPDASAA